MTVEEGIKMVVSGGIVTPPDRRGAAEEGEDEDEDEGEGDESKIAESA